MIDLTSRQGWAVQIEGEKEDVDDLKKNLNGAVKSPTDYFIAEFLGMDCLATSRWDNFTVPADVFEHAEQALDFLSGCLNLMNSTPEMKPAAIIHFFGDGSYEQHRILRLEITVREAKGDRCSPAQFRRLLELSEKHDWLLGCLPLFAPGADKQRWFEIYKIIESLETHFGGEAAMVRSKLVDGPSLKRLKRMANSFRHIGSTHSAPVPAIPLADARALVRSTLRALIAAL